MLWAGAELARLCLWTTLSLLTCGMSKSSQDREVVARKRAAVGWPHKKRLHCISIQNKQFISSAQRPCVVLHRNKSMLFICAYSKKYVFFCFDIRTTSLLTLFHFSRNCISIFEQFSLSVLIFSISWVLPSWVEWLSEWFFNEVLSGQNCLVACPLQHAHVCVYVLSYFSQDPS